jgi:hypothetical protein
MILLNPSLPSCRWLLAGLHHPLHHTLHPDRWLTEVPLFFELLGFVLGVATVIGRYKSLLRPLMLGCLVSWSMRPRSLISWCLMVWDLIPWSLELGRRSSAMISLSGHFFSWPWLSELLGESTEDEHAHLGCSDGIWEVF